MKSSHSPKRPKPSHYLEYFGFKIAYLGIGFIPPFLHVTIASVLSWLWFYLLPVRKQLVLQNLRLAFPDKDSAWRNRTARACLAHFVRMMVFETRIVHSGNRAGINKLVAGFSGLENLEAAGGWHCPMIMTGGHLGNWEVAIVYFYLQVEGFKPVALAKPLHNPLMESDLSTARSKLGVQVISTRSAELLKEISTVFRQNRPLAIVADQDARHNGVFVPFFSVNASTPMGPAMFARRFKIPIVTGNCVRSSQDGLYRIEFGPAIYPDPQVGRKEDILRMTREHTATLERHIREYPEQYFWFHRRWKTREKKGKV